MGDGSRYQYHVMVNINGTQARFQILRAGDDMMASSVRLDLAAIGPRRH